MIERADRAISERVIRAREDAGLSKSEFGERLGLSKQGYQHYENFTTPFTVQQLFAAARILERPVEHFLGLRTELTPEEQQLLVLFRKAQKPEQRAGIINLLRVMIDGFLAER